MDSCKVMPQIVVRALFGVILMLKKIVYCKNLLLVAPEVLLNLISVIYQDVFPEAYRG